MKSWFAASLALTALAAAPLQGAPVWVPIVNPQGAGGQTLATRLWISNQAGETRPYSSTFRQAASDVTEPTTEGTVPAARAVYFDKASAQGETGLLEIDAAQELNVDAWIQTRHGKLTFTTRVPVISDQNLVEAGATTFLNGLDRNLAKIGVVNLGAEATRCDVDFLRADGSFAGEGATLDLAAGSMQHLEDALPMDEAVSAQVSCGQAFYAYGVAVNARTSEVSFATPETEMALAAKPKATVSPKGTVVFNAPGVFHKASPQKEKAILQIPVPQALALRQMTIDWDVTPGPWSSKNPAGCHAMIWLYRGKFRSNTVANVNFYGPKKNFLKNNQNLDLPKGANTNASGGMNLEQGKVYHLHYVYDAVAESVVVTVTQNGRVMRTMKMPGTAANHTLTVPASGLVSEFGHYSFQSGPEVATWGWSYSNLRVEMIQQ
ncbi:MAG TPA: hypothetical protein VF173_32480 [Thermoanaerobaculia bacterium]|nr:hypothetical protein [Thermoanaerobaculia bacterium]